MSSTSNTRATLRAHAARLETIANQGDGEGDLDIAAAASAIAETLSELFGGGVGDVSVVEDGDEVVITFSTADGELEDDEPAEEAVANMAGIPSKVDRSPSDADEYPSGTYSEWLAEQERDGRANASTDGDRPAAVAYGDWVDPRGD